MEKNAPGVPNNQITKEPLEPNTFKSRDCSEGKYLLLISSCMKAFVALRAINTRTATRMLPEDSAIESCPLVLSKQLPLCKERRGWSVKTNRRGFNCALRNETHPVVLISLPIRPTIHLCINNNNHDQQYCLPFFILNPFLCFFPLYLLLCFASVKHFSSYFKEWELE